MGKELANTIHQLIKKVVAQSKDPCTKDDNLPLKCKQVDCDPGTAPPEPTGKVGWCKCAFGVEARKNVVNFGKCKFAEDCTKVDTAPLKCNQVDCDEGKTPPEPTGTKAWCRCAKGLEGGVCKVR